MNRELLESLGLDKEAIDKVMAAHGKAVTELKSKADKADELAAANETLTTQLSDRDKDLKSLKKGAGDNEELNKQLSELQSKYTTETQALQDQIASTKLNGALSTALVEAKVRNPKAVKGLLDMDKIKLDDKDQLSGLEDQLQAIHESDSYLFDEGTKQDYNPAGGNPSDQDPTQTLVDAFKN
ncbi:phage scaffolding protein [Lacticaseibacillus saniviri]|uniref:Phage minor structural protein GP20 n=1 Tax=Lacticaseibacillus saniviri JCM 17471 = DSM 24301 TaxID=1293598 RepID=A0A0R2MUT4_9LACO|nr:phage scaffolding protein [Lacticaseibacillus saniviri]KRO16636.1 phage minor structural protein GP20 [Lacticaseibacillus saniviri JCM 17471 = DSM 24301]